MPLPCLCYRSPTTDLPSRSSDVPLCQPDVLLYTLGSVGEPGGPTPPLSPGQVEEAREYPCMVFGPGAKDERMPAFEGASGCAVHMAANDSLQLTRQSW
jgi:hypothetical protein